MGPFLADRWWLNHDYKRDAIHWFKPLFAGAERHQESQAYYKYTGHSSFMTAFLVVQLNISCALSPPRVTFQWWAIILSPVLIWITYFFLGAPSPSIRSLLVTVLYIHLRHLFDRQNFSTTLPFGDSIPSARSPSPARHVHIFHRCPAALEKINER